jgi:hypothetical protein
LVLLARSGGEFLVLRQAQDEEFEFIAAKVALILSLSKDEGGPPTAARRAFGRET